jgi:ATP-dependent DNA helicase RecG
LDQLKTDTYQSRTRNKLIAEAFYLTHNIEKYGSGFIRIRQELQAYPEVSFHLEEIGGGMLVTFKSNEGVSEGVNDLLSFITQHPGLRIPEFSRQMAVPPKTLERWLKQLRDEHKIKYKGSPKTGGYHLVIGN